MKHPGRILAMLGTLVIAGVVFYAGVAILGMPKNQTVWGVSFDSSHARYLGLDVKASFAQIVGEWQFKKIRLAAHWDNIQKNGPGVYDFSELDYLMNQARKSGAKVILAVGQKTPRWPECHRPAWLDTLSDSRAPRLSLLAYIKTVVERYKNHPALEIWQVENEPFLAFGLCPKYTATELTEEIALVRSLDATHPILITDSGELSSWRRTARAGDLFGTTMYRVVWNKYLGYLSYDWLPAAFYRFKLWVAGRNQSAAFVIELQGEPWIPGQDPQKLKIEEQFKSLDLARLKKNILYARAVGWPRAYLWGAEWWQWMARQGYPEFGEFIKNLPKE
ncbi:MAG: cellulase family glycosylhydrolase [Candidatus Magasanikbacteria bacterium]|nr:cellulase family glycosylhydrolase [Candidatus Magasanikbacteria bacterium]